MRTVGAFAVVDGVDAVVGSGGALAVAPAVGAVDGFVVSGVATLAALALAGITALIAMPVPRAVATPRLSEATSARPRGAACGRRPR